MAKTKEKNSKTLKTVKSKFILIKGFSLHEKRLTIIEKRESGKKRILISAIFESFDYPLRAVSIEELMELRIKDTPGFVFKEGSDYFYTEIPKTIKFFSDNLMGAHCCSLSQNKGDCCKHLSTFFNEQSGCAKVLDKNIDFHLRHGHSKSEAVIYSKRIEKYDYIEVGYETFNTLIPSLIVLKCRKHE